MRCPSCACPGFAPLLFGGICVNPKCTQWYDSKAYDKGVWNSSQFTLNGDSVMDIQLFLSGAGEIEEP